MNFMSTGILPTPKQHIMHIRGLCVFAPQTTQNNKLSKVNIMMDSIVMIESAFHPIFFETVAS